VPLFVCWDFEDAKKHRLQKIREKVVETIIWSKKNCNFMI
jgi:hypothetical protein